MKKKLLITMGCSFTEGVGCWDMSVTPPNTRQNISKEWVELLLHPRNRQKFHKDGWPNRVGKKLGFDKVINIATLGGSTSGQVKKFVEKIIPNDFSEYDVMVLFQLPNVDRISFYSNSEIVSLVPHDTHNLYLSFVEFIKDDYDLFLEQIFYINVMGQMCENNNFDFRTISLLGRKNLDYNFYADKLNNKKYTPYFVINGKETNSPICGHYDENGYEVISETISKYIRDNVEYLKNISPKDDIEWEYYE